MNYCVRVDFPDADKYVYLTHETGINKGQLKKYPTRELAEADAKRYAGANVMDLEDYNSEKNISRDSRAH